MKKNKYLISISGPSTSGKTTLAALFKEDGFKEVVSTTTRPKRNGEIMGVSYYFTDEKEFSEHLKNNDLVEHVNVGKYFYGVSKKAISDVIESNSPAVVVVEPEGAKNIAEYCREKDILLHKVFVNNDMNILIQRLQKRFNEDKNAKLEVYQERLWNMAIIEPELWTKKAYSGEHYYDQIFDSFLPENQNEIKNSIMDAIEKKLKPTTKARI